jgi:hypothetical protein
MPDRKLNEQEIAILKEYERSRRLRELTGCAGWQDLLQLMAVRVGQAQKQLIEAKYADKEVIWAFQRRAHDYNEFAQLIRNDVESAVEKEQEIPQLLTVPLSEYDGELSAY